MEERREGEEGRGRDKGKARGGEGARKVNRKGKWKGREGERRGGGERGER